MRKRPLGGGAGQMIEEIRISPAARWPENQQGKEFLAPRYPVEQPWRRRVAGVERSKCHGSVGWLVLDDSQLRRNDAAEAWRALSPGENRAVIEAAAFALTVLGTHFAAQRSVMRFFRPTRRPAAQPGSGVVRPLSRIEWGCGTLRRFGREAISDETLQTILGLAGQAPTSGNREPWRFVVVRDPHQQERLSRALEDGARCIRAPVILVAYGRRDEEVTVGDAMFDGHALPQSNGAIASAYPCQTLLNPVRARDAGLWLTRQVMTAFTYLMMAAEALGWDTAPLENFDADVVREVVELPEDAEVVALLAIGRCERHVATAAPRLPLEEFVCMERFGVPWAARRRSTPERVSRKSGSNLAHDSEMPQGATIPR